MASIHDIEHSPSSTPLLQPENSGHLPAINRRSLKLLSSTVAFVLLLLSLVALIRNQQVQQTPNHANTEDNVARKLSPTTSVQTESSKRASRAVEWQRSAYHYQPEKNFMSDPNGPLFHMGWYHIFYQYDPISAVWGNISWGHAVSKDMINWYHLPLAMVPDKWYDIQGVLTGSATIMADGQIVVLYTGNAYNFAQLQCLAWPKNVSDPLLLDWVKYEHNPVIYPPPGVGMKDFRDPSPGWMGPDGKWRIVIGSRHNTTGITLIYKTTDFINFELMEDFLHAVNGTAMWECIDLYPVSTINTTAFSDPSITGPDIKHVLKESWDEHGIDWYSIGTYDPENDKWTPDDPTMDLGLGLKYDYGRFYASKTFYDANKKRRVLWGFSSEADTREADLNKGWATVLNTPRTVVFDHKTGTNILQWPLEEIENLRLDSHEFNDVELSPGSLIPLEVGTTTQLDIIATFELDNEVLEAKLEDANDGYDCIASPGAGGRGVLGPFGLVVLADEKLIEQTAVYFYVAKDSTTGSATTHFCSDQTRSTALSNVVKDVMGTTVPVLTGEKYSLRLLVDHSIVESFAMGGRRVTTSRVYPTRAIDGKAKLFLFNNATEISVKASVTTWHMGAATIEAFPFDK